MAGWLSVALLVCIPCVLALFAYDALAILLFRRGEYRLVPVHDLARAVAQAIVDLRGEQAAPAELALLFETARDFGPAAHYFLAAARRAAELFANAEAHSLAVRSWDRLVRCAVRLSDSGPGRAAGIRGEPGGVICHSDHPCAVVCAVAEVMATGGAVITSWILFGALFYLL